MRKVLLVFFITLACQIVFNGCSSDSCKDAQAKIAAMEHDVWNLGSIEKIDELFLPDCMLHFGSGENFIGTAALKESIIQFHKGVDRCNFKIEDIFCTENKIVERFSWAGILKAGGGTISSTGCVIYRLKNNKIAEAWSFEDNRNLYLQAGKEIHENLY